MVSSDFGLYRWKEECSRDKMSIPTGAIIFSRTRVGAVRTGGGPRVGAVRTGGWGEYHRVLVRRSPPPPEAHLKLPFFDARDRRDGAGRRERHEDVVEDVPFDVAPQPPHARERPAPPARHHGGVRIVVAPPLWRRSRASFERRRPPPPRVSRERARGRDPRSSQSRHHCQQYREKLGARHGRQTEVKRAFVRPCTRGADRPMHIKTEPEPAHPSPDPCVKNGSRTARRVRHSTRWRAHTHTPPAPACAPSSRRSTADRSSGRSTTSRGSRLRPTLIQTHSRSSVTRAPGSTGSSSSRYYPQTVCAEAVVLYCAELWRIPHSAASSLATSRISHPLE